MPKASIKLQSGAVVDIEGTPEEVFKLLSFYGPASNADTAPRDRLPKPTPSASRKDAKPAPEERGESTIDIVGIVNLIKSCDEADRVEAHILDNSSQLPRLLLPLYIVHEHMDNKFGLTSGDISKITTELGVPIAVANASKTLARQSKYVIGDKVRKNGQAVRYKLSRRGSLYFKDLIDPKKPN